MQESLTIGVIGMGGMGTRHAVNLHRHVGAARVAGVYDFDMERARQGATACGGAPVFDDPYTLIADAGIDAVIIASPDPTHVEFTLACLRHQKPVLCEKPLATGAQDAARVIEAETARGERLVAVGFMRRFDPQHVAVRRIADSGALGRSIMYKGVHRNAGPSDHARGETVLTNSASHDIDATRWLLGREIDEVYVRGVRSHRSMSADTRDLLLLSMSLGDECLATVEVFVSAEYGYEVSAEIVGERGSAVTGQPQPAIVRSSAVRGTAVASDWLERFQDAYVAELNAWIGALRSGQPFAGASAWDGYIALLITEACIRSLRSGTPERVALPDRPALYAHDR